MNVFAFMHVCMFVGQLIISKVFLGRSAAVKEGRPIDCHHYPKANSVYLSTSSKQQNQTAQTGELECVYSSEKSVFSVFNVCVFVHQTCCVLPACQIAATVDSSRNCGTFLTMKW